MAIQPSRTIRSLDVTTNWRNRVVYPDSTGRRIFAINTKLHFVLSRSSAEYQDTIMQS